MNNLHVRHDAGSSQSGHNWHYILYSMFTSCHLLFNVNVKVI